MALLPYTVPQTYKRSVGSTKAAATCAVDNLLLVHLMHGSTLVYIYCGSYLFEISLLAFSSEGSQRPQEVPPEVPKRLSRTPQSALGPRLEKTGHDKKRPPKTKTRQAKSREDQSDRSQHKIRQYKTRGRTTRGDQRGEVYAPKRRCFPTRFHKRTKGLSDPRRPRPLEPSTTAFSCI